MSDSLTDMLTPQEGMLAVALSQQLVRTVTGFPSRFDAPLLPATVMVAFAMALGSFVKASGPADQLDARLQQLQASIKEAATK